MKFSTFPILIILSMIGCSTFGKITAVKDEFKNTTMVKVTLNQKTKETVGPFSMANPGILEYYREIDPKQNYSPASVKIKIYGNPDDPDISNKAFLGIGGKNYEIVLSEIKGVSVSGVQTSTGTGTTYARTASGGIDYSKPNHNSQVVTTRSYNYKTLSAVITFTKEQELAILNGNSLVFRIYVGTSPYTFELNPDNDLGIVKNFLNTKGN